MMNELPSPSPRSPGDSLAPEFVPCPARKGRGAVGNPTGRYEPATKHRVDDGWCGAARLRDEERKLRTTVQADATRTVIARNDSPDLPFDRSINPYRGCEHGCVYCFARPTHAYLGLSPGLDFETRLFMKPDAPERLEAELAKPGYRCAPIAMGTNTDPYQPAEREHEITRGILEVLAKYDHPVSIVTKSALVTRDLDILAPMARKGLASVALSVTTLDRGLAMRMEPRAATPARRLDAIRELADAGIPTAVMAAPMIPALNDMELEAILEAAASMGARRASYILLRLPMEVKALFEDWLRHHYPNLAGHVLSLVRDTRGGALYEATFGTRLKGRGPYADLLEKRFALACKRLRLNREDARLDTAKFRKPARERAQLTLF